MSTSSPFYPDGLPHYGEIGRFSKMTAETGCGHICLCSLEWNVGPVKDTVAGRHADAVHERAALHGDFLADLLAGE